MQVIKLLIALQLLLVLASCGPKKEQQTEILNPYGLPHCSNEERTEVTRKATSEYSFVILPKLNDLHNDPYCDEIRTFMKAIDLLPPKVRVEYERAKKKHSLVIFVARDSVSEHVGSTEEHGVAGVFGRDDFGLEAKAYITITSRASQRSFWHEIGHFLDYAIMANLSHHCEISDMEYFKNEYARIYSELVARGENTYFMKSSKEGFAEAFSFYLSNKVVPYHVNHKDYKQYYTFFKFFDELFDNPEKKINDNIDN